MKTWLYFYLDAWNELEKINVQIRSLAKVIIENLSGLPVQRLS